MGIERARDDPRVIVPARRLLLRRPSACHLVSILPQNHIKWCGAAHQM